MMEPPRRPLTYWPAAEFDMGGERAWYVPWGLGTRDWGSLVGKPDRELVVEWPACRILTCCTLKFLTTIRLYVSHPK